MKTVSDTLTVTFDSGLDDEAGICISRVVNGKVSILKMELGEQADILYHLLTEQTTKAAIKVDQERTGHWVEETINEYSRKVFCSECGCPPPFEHVSTGDIYSANGYGVTNKTKFCPNCGIRMKSEVDND